MAASLVQCFLDCPSVDQLERCRKVDLLAIAEHYGISVPKVIVVADLKQLLLTELIAAQVLVAQVKPDSPVPSERSSPKGPGDDDEAPGDDDEAVPSLTGSASESMVEIVRASCRERV